MDRPAVIDLTEEPDSPILQHRPVPHNRRDQRRNNGGSSRNGPPQHQPAVIDLTEDGDDDVMPIASRSGPGALQEWFQNGHAQLPHLPFPTHGHADFDQSLHAHAEGSRGSARSRAQSIFNLANLSGLNAFSIGNIGSLAQFTNYALDNIPTISSSRGHISGGGSGSGSGHRHGQSHRSNHAGNNAGRAAQARNNYVRGHHRAHMADEFDIAPFIFRGGINPLQGNVPDLDYQLNGLFEAAMPNMHAPNDKPPYVAPPPAPEGFSRSTGEELVSVCAGCEEELAYDEEAANRGSCGGKAGEPPTKRSRNRKDREEHYFWAATACGHVYCKRCFEHRKNVIKGDKSAPSVFFKTDGKAVFCAVEGCRNDVSAKKAWVGLFV